MKQQIDDPIVLRVLAKISERSKAGIEKYNSTLERDDYTLEMWLQEAQEEAMDFCCYLEAAMQAISKMKVVSKSKEVNVKYDIK
jgi:hypothetical protein